MTSSPSARHTVPPFQVVVNPQTIGKVLPIWDRLFVGRECFGIDPQRALLIEDDRAVSRNHLEIRIDPHNGDAFVIDTSSNGTRLNGVRIERATAIPLSSGDRLTVGSTTLQLQKVGRRVLPAGRALAKSTAAISQGMAMAMVVGDIIDFSTVSQHAEPSVLSRVAQSLYGDLRRDLVCHRGTLANYVGDAFFAIWEAESDEAAATQALQFAASACRVVQRVSPRLTLRYQDGTPLRMGWGVSFGEVSVRLLPGSLVTVLGDAANVAFRLSSVAGRQGKPMVLLTHKVRHLVSTAEVSEPFEQALKGREGTETVYGLRTVDSFSP